MVGSFLLGQFSVKYSDRLLHVTQMTTVTVNDGVPVVRRDSPQRI
jgi:hypothetical protein